MSLLSSCSKTTSPAGPWASSVNIDTCLDTGNLPRTEEQLLLRFKERNGKKKNTNPHQHNDHVAVQTLQSPVHLEKLGKNGLDEMLADLTVHDWALAPKVCYLPCSSTWELGGLLWQRDDASLPSTLLGAESPSSWTYSQALPSLLPQESQSQKNIGGWGLKSQDLKKQALLYFFKKIRFYWF